MTSAYTKKPQKSRVPFAKQIALTLRDSVLRQAYTRKKHIFLCGKSLDDSTSLRSQLHDFFTQGIVWPWRYEIVFPEDLFQELLTGPFHHDLLTLENSLADAVDAIVLVPESPGSFAELGAFANHEKLREKLIVVQREQYRNNQSFLNYGPIRLLKDRKVGKTLFVDPNHIDRDFTAVQKAVNEFVKAGHLQSRYTLNALTVDTFLLACLYVLETPDKPTLCEVVSHASAENPQAISGIVEVGLHILRKEKLVANLSSGLRYRDSGVEVSQLGFALTQAGIEKFQKMKQHGSKVLVRTEMLDTLRCEVMSFAYRHKAIQLLT